MSWFIKSKYKPQEEMMRNLKNNAVKRRKAFTLIELLVVIAIIAILAGMLLPALKKARDKAHVVTCTGNLKTLSSAIFLYGDSWNGWFGPINMNGGSTRFPPYMWVNALYVNGYLPARNRDLRVYDTDPSHMEKKTTAILICPFTVWSDPLKTGWTLTSGGMSSGDYGFNYFLTENKGLIGGNGYHRLTTVKNPSSRLMLADANRYVVTENSYPTVSGKYTILYRHNNQASAAAADGSIQTIRQTRFKLDGKFR